MHQLGGAILSKRRKHNVIINISNTNASSKRITLREENLAEDKELGIEHITNEMTLIRDVLYQHGINFRLWLTEYLTAAEQNDMKPPSNFEDYLPWNMSSEMKERLSKNTTFSYGNANFLQKTNGTVYHLLPDGTQKVIDIGSLTAEEFDKLISA